MNYQEKGLIIGILSDKIKKETYVWNIMDEFLFLE